jgi:predicted DNA binding protein
MGYFDSPRQSNATEVAESLGIGPSTLADHLAAESKLVGQTID